VCITRGTLGTINGRYILRTGGKDNDRDKAQLEDP